MSILGFRTKDLNIKKVFAVIEFIEKKTWILTIFCKRNNSKVQYVRIGHLSKQF